MNTRIAKARWAALLCLSFLSLSCADEPPAIDQVQENLVDKAIFEGEWWYSSTTIDVAKLQAAFNNVFQTMDAIDTFRAQAVDAMAQTVTALEGQIERAKPYLERTRQSDGA